MKQAIISTYNNLFLSGHSFAKDETLLKFQYRVLNSVLIVIALFSFIFSILSSLELNQLGAVQTMANYILAVCAIVILIRLRGPKERYIKCAYLMYAVSFLDFVSAFVFVPDDEFRIIWFYLLGFAAYITGGTRIGNIVIFFSIVVIVLGNMYLDLQLSQKAVITSILGLIIAMLFFSAYTKKIIDFEKEITEQEALMIAQSRFAAMGEMMSMIAHQWRQPLSTMTLLIANERIKRMLDTKELNEYDKILEKISETMIYLSDTIDDFQTYFKPDKNTQEIYVSELIKRVESFIEARLVLSKVQINLEEYENRMINTYANEVVQVLINIINNSIDIFEERDITDRKIWIKISYDNDDAYIRIEDNAGGVNKDIIDRVFEPYFSEKSKNGTGLGLYMSKMIIEKHINGTLDVANSKNGACFSIKIPKNPIPFT